jgi:hypothetical protein
MEKEEGRVLGGDLHSEHLSYFKYFMFISQTIYTVHHFQMYPFVSCLSFIIMRRLRRRLYTQSKNNLDVRLW